MATMSTDRQVQDAIDLAKRVIVAPDCFKPTRDVAVDLAMALLQLADTLARASTLPPGAIKPGDLMRVSVRLLTDLYEMPGHESCTVRYAYAERGADGVHVLMCTHAEEAVCQ